MRRWKFNKNDCANKNYYVISLSQYRSSHKRCSVRTGVLRNFAKFTGKHLCQGLFFNKVARLRPTTLLKKRLVHWCFPGNFVKFLRTPFLHSTSGRLLLPIGLWFGDTKKVELQLSKVLLESFWSWGFLLFQRCWITPPSPCLVLGYEKACFG